MAVNPKAEQSPGITPRAVLLGLLCTAVLGVATPYCDLVVQGTWIACCHLPIGVFVLLMVLLGINAPLLRFTARLGFARRELFTVYAMMLVGSGIPSFGLTEYLFPTLAGAYYFASPENGWVDRFFQYLPQWMVPFDVQGAMASAASGGATGGANVYPLLPSWMQPGGREVAVSFYEGLRVGQRLPWGAWVVPIITWTAAALVLFGVLICFSTLLRRRWIEHERLVFPLVQVPLEVVTGQSAASPLPPFFRNRLMWLGCAIPLLVHSLNGLHFYFPAVPEIKLAWPLNQYFTGRIWSNMGIFMMILHFSVVGFSYLISTELSFSLWFFFLVFIGESALLSFMGLQLHPLPGYPTPPHGALQMIGAFFMLAGYMAWSGRRHFRDIWVKAVGGPSALNDEDEPLPFRQAVWGLLGGVLLLVLWCVAAGVPAGLAVVVLVFFLMFALVLTRLVSEGGLLFVQAFRPTDVIIAGAGTAILGARSQVVLSLVQKAFMFDLRTFLMPSLMDAYRLAASSGLNARRLLPWLFAAVLTATVSSYVALLLMTYRLGGVRFMGWFMIYSPQQTLTYVNAYLNSPYPTSVGNWALMLCGTGTTALLSLMRALHAWWPLHPLGYAMGPSWPMIQLWFSIMVGWMLKSLILRYGGFRRFRDAKPFFLGLVVGEFGVAGLWLLVDFITGKTGHRFFLF